MQLVITELERKVSEEIIIKCAVDEFGVNHKSKIEHLVKLLHDEAWEIELQPLKCNPSEYTIIMTRKEYELVFQAFKNYRLYMTKEQEVLSEKILDDLFYPEFDKLSTDDLVADAEEALANESGIKSLNFRS